MCMIERSGCVTATSFTTRITWNPIAVLRTLRGALSTNRSRHGCRNLNRHGDGEVQGSAMRRAGGGRRVSVGSHAYVAARARRRRLERAFCVAWPTRAQRAPSSRRTAPCSAPSCSPTRSARTRRGRYAGWGIGLNLIARPQHSCRTIHIGSRDVKIILGRSHR
jgi:hypothetical protein